MKNKAVTGIPGQYLEIVEILNEQNIGILEDTYYLLRDMTDIRKIQLIEDVAKEIRCIIEDKSPGFVELE